MKTKTKLKQLKIENGWKRKNENKNENENVNSKTCHSMKELAYNTALMGAMAVRRWIHD